MRYRVLFCWKSWKVYNWLFFIFCGVDLQSVLWKGTRRLCAMKKILETSEIWCFSFQKSERLLRYIIYNISVIITIILFTTLFYIVHSNLISSFHLGSLEPCTTQGNKLIWKVICMPYINNHLRSGNQIFLLELLEFVM